MTRNPMSHPTCALVIALFLGVAYVPGVAADHSYQLGTFVEWDTTTLDVLVLTGDDPIQGAAILRGISVWETGIAALAPDWLRDSLVLRIHAPAIDPVPPEGFEPHDLEIVFVPQGFYAVSFPQGTTDGPQCIANAPLAYEYPLAGPGALYRVAAHEFGHCLGLGHVFEHGVEYAPYGDLMGGGREADACPSNLNIQALERSYGGLFGRPSGGTVSMPSSEYFQIAC